MKLPLQNQYRKEWAENKGVKELEIVKPHLTNTRVCLDIGAHIGATSIKYSKIFDTVYSFEPIPYLYDLLKENTQNFENIKTLNVAASDIDGLVEIYENKKNSESNVVVHEDTMNLINSRLKDAHVFGGVKPKKVVSRTIDNYKFYDVDFIKIDVERYTIPVLKGMITTLKNNSPILQVEVENVSSITFKTENLLKELKYVPFEKMSGDWFYKK